MPIMLEETMKWEDIRELFLKRLIENGYLKQKKDIASFRTWFDERKSVGLGIGWKLVGLCYRIWKELREDRDHFITLTGKEGTGKSTLAMHLASWIQGPSFKPEQVCIATSDYFDVIEGDKYRSIILDEAVLQMFSRESMSKDNRMFSKLFFIMRAMNLCTICCLPNLKYADSVLKEHRTKTLIYCMTRGKCKVIFNDGLEAFMKGMRKGLKAEYTPVPYGCFFESFWRKKHPNTISWDVYQARKMKGVAEYIKGVKKDIMDVQLMPLAKAARSCGISHTKMVDMVKKKEIDGKKIGNKWLITKVSYQKLINTNPS